MIIEEEKKIDNESQEQTSKMLEKGNILSSTAV